MAQRSGRRRSEARSGAGADRGEPFDDGSAGVADGARGAAGEAVRRQGIHGVERALSVLSLFAAPDRPTLGVTEIAHELGLSKAVVHRVLSAFRGAGFVESDPETHRYELGPQILFLGLAYLDRLDVRGIAHHAMSELVRLTNETSTLSARVGWDCVYLDQVTPNRTVKLQVQLGRPFPLHTGAASKTLLAFLPEEEREEYLTRHELVRLTSRSITDASALRHELEAIRDRGFAVSYGELEGSCGAVAAPIFGYEGVPLAVISVSGPIERFGSEIEASAKILEEEVHRVSQRLGYRPELPARGSARADA